VVFFFHAEDGIRDPLVTGVQTCALPISWRTCQEAEPVYDMRCDWQLLKRWRAVRSFWESRSKFLGTARFRFVQRSSINRRPPTRSEERRVGKEGSSWSGREDDDVRQRAE